MLSRLGIFSLCVALLAACAHQKPISRPSAKREPPARSAPPVSERAPVFDAPAPAIPGLEQAPMPADGDEAALTDETLRLALLLPLSGALTASSEAIRDGFLAAHYGHNGQSQVRVYDSGLDVASMRIAYGDALRDGAQAIAGPLRKEDVQAFADGGSPAVPVLALNYLDAGRLAPARFYQFGLNAEDEARAAAHDAAAQGLRRALTLTSDDEWGERARKSFEQEFASQGGVVSSAQRYDTASTDFSQPIRSLLAIDASNERHRALTSLLGAKPVFEPRRRADADLIFFAARGEAVRQMAPQLRFHRASGLPIYATASVYAGGEPSTDLNGVRFCDGPWMTDGSGVWADARNQTLALFPGRAPELARLNALGHDAYTLVNLLAQQRLPDDALPAATGRLHLSSAGIFSRELSCVEVAGGALKASR